MKQTVKQTELKHIPQSIMIICKYLKPTDSRGAMFKLTTYDLQPWTNNKPKSIVMPYSYDYNSATQDAQKSIELAGLEIISMNSNCNSSDTFMCKWNNVEFHKLAKLFKTKIEEL